MHRAAPLYIRIVEADLAQVALVLREGAPEEAEGLLQQLWENGGPVEQRIFLLELAAAGSRCMPSVERALQWSARLREAGLVAACPLVGMAADPGRLPSERIRAAATVSRAFQDRRANRLIQDAARDLLGADRRALARAEVAQLAPPLVTELDRAWAGTPAAPPLACGDWPWKASIIIPLYNQLPFTRRCLEFMGEVTDARDYEVVLVDNASSDGTAEFCASLEGDVQVLRNEENLGFAGACNQGAAAARGEVLVFLNNDTEPRPGWLRALLRVLDTSEDVGIVGAKLLFPNGTIQHAGSNLVRFENADNEIPLAGIHSFYGYPGDFPEANLRRDLQVVTGALMAVRREAFDAGGGFEEGYWNGAEDVELCLAARAAGWRIVYEPASCAVHHEGASGAERWKKEQVNMLRLFERWSGRIVPDVVVRLDGTVETTGPLPPPGSRPATAAASAPVDG